MAYCPTLSGLAALARPLHSSLCTRHNASPGPILVCGTGITNFGWKRLDSGSVDQPTKCHAPITESHTYHESETQAEYCHRGSRSTRRGDPYPHLSSHFQPNQLFTRSATCLRRSSGTDKAEPRTPPRF